MYGVLAAVMFAVGVGFAVFTSRDESTSERAAMHALIERTAPGMCAMQARTAAKDRAGAFNVFYDEVHTGAHALEAELLRENTKADLEEFVRSKSRVESDLRTLAPSLNESVNAFAKQLHLALDDYEVGLWTSC